MTFITEHVRPMEPALHNLTYGVDGQLWCSTLTARTIMSLNPDTTSVTTRFEDDSFCTFRCNGRLGVIGTMDGRLLSFEVAEPKVNMVVEMKDSKAVSPIDIDEDFESCFFACGGIIYRVSFDGEPLGRWPCRIAPGSIHYIRSRCELWSICDGIEVINLATNKSTVYGAGRRCLYTRLAESTDGRIACFGGNVDILAAPDDLIVSISGDFNSGLFTPSGRLLAREVTKDFPNNVTVSTRLCDDYEIDVISHCNSFVLSPDERLIIASHRGKLFYLWRT